MEHPVVQQTGVLTTDIPETQTQPVQFKREISLFGGISIIGGIMVGSGIFYLGSYVLMRTGMSLGLALVAWIVGGIVSLLGGLCYAELGASDTRAGGTAVYLREAFHPVVGFMSGFSSWALGGPGSIAALAIALPSILTAFIPMSEMTIKIVAILLIIGLTVVNCFGVKLGSRLQNVSMIAKIIPIAIILILGLVRGTVTPNLSLQPVEGSGSIFSLFGMLAFAVVATLWAYEGWTNLNTVTEEIRQPEKNLPRAIMIAIGGITLLYTLFNYAIYRVLPFEQIQSLLASDQLYLGTFAAQALLGPAGATLVSVGMIVSIFGSLNGCVLAFPRMHYAMAQDGHFFNSFKKLHPKYAVPTSALIVQGLISIVLVLLRNLNQLTSLVVFSSMLFSMLTVIAVFRYRQKFPDLKRPYKVFLYPVTVIVTALIFFGLLINTLMEDPVTSIMGLSIPLIGIAVYYAFGARNRRQQQEA
jgi:APA family basic amino acid/polyamine antiporter